MVFYQNYLFFIHFQVIQLTLIGTKVKKPQLLDVVRGMVRHVLHVNQRIKTRQTTRTCRTDDPERKSMERDYPEFLRAELS